MKNTLVDEKLKTVFTEDEKKTIETQAEAGIKWIEVNPDADADAIAGKQKEIEAKYNPIMMRVYQAAGGPGAGGMPGMGGFPGGGMGGAGTGAGGATDAGVEDLD
jgi:heat shock protein 1/8